jgi:hypothetical protein
MKSFLKKLLLFLLPLLLLYGALEFQLSRLPNNFTRKKDFFETQLDEIEVLIAGPSYANTINPQFLSYKGFNLFNDAEDIFYHVKLVEKTLERMPKLKLIILPISYYSLEYRLDQSPASWRVAFYQSVWSIPPRSALSYFNPILYSYTAAYGWREVLSLMERGFISSDQRVLYANGWREIGSQTIAENAEWERSGWQLVELNESMMRVENIAGNMQLLGGLIETCQNRGIQVMLITTPLHHFYYDHLKTDKLARMQENIQLLVNQYQVPYLNFMKDERFKAEDFYNPDHVSNAGAEKFSRLMDEIIRNSHLFDGKGG